MAILTRAARTLVAIDFLFLLLLGVTFLYVEPGSPAFVVAVLTIFPVVATLVASIVVIYTDWTPFG